MTAYSRHWSAEYSGFYLRAADGRRTRVYQCLDAARRALERGELYSDADYAAGRFGATPGNPRPGHTTFAEQAANARADAIRRKMAAQHARGASRSAGGRG